MPDPHGVPMAAEFGAFFRAVHGHDPFPWQEALVADVLGQEAWPDLVDVPTGLGKTSMLDVAVFVAAATAHLPGAGRLGRRRCFFVVDRRIVVDEAHAHAVRLAGVLAAAERARDGGTLGRVAAALRSYAPGAAGGDLLSVTRMRGGATWDAAWLDRPDRPGIVLGTVDQVGSRLLFRGYGVSDRRRPLDAALVGTDALLLVDEAHLSTALLATVSAARERDRLGLPLPGLSVVRLSATGVSARKTFALDVDAHRANPVAWRRLTAGKHLTVVEATTRDVARVLAGAVLEQVATLSATTSPHGYAPTAVVVCNTVDRARAVHAHLLKQVSARGATVKADCDLLIGRSRPVDRPVLQERVLARFGAGRAPSPTAVVLVATQTVEVGVNLDADVLVTESASWDALVQRLGRLNRLGTFAERFPDAGPAVAVVVHDGQDDGPVYGSARDATWRVLTGLTAAAPDGALDVSPLACRQLPASAFTSDCVRRPVGVPVLLGPTLDAWVQTAPVPSNDPPVEPFLHGFDSGVAGVRVVWRDGLLSDDRLDDPFSDPCEDDPFEGDGFEGDGAELAASRVDGLLVQWPPRTAEAVEVPFVAVRQWMSGQVPDPVSDLESVPEADGRARKAREPFRALACRPPGAGSTKKRSDASTVWRWIEAGDLRPGDVIVVPSRRGGLDGFGWFPAGLAPVRDVSEIVTFLPGRGHREAVLRLDHGLPARLGLSGGGRAVVADLVADLLREDGEDLPREGEPAVSSAEDRLRWFGQALAAALPDHPDPAGGWPPEAWKRLRAWAGSGRLRIVELLDSSPSVVAGDDEPQIWGQLLAGPVLAGPVKEAAASSVAAGSAAAGRVTLVTHHGAVRQRAGQIAAALGLSPSLRDVVQDAAGWHDLGKVEERFQAMLHGGDAYEAALAVEPLAKSGMDPVDRLARRRVRQLSRLPVGARHEAWSAALVEEYLRGRDYPGDVDLLLHLVASHHGYARPLARLVVDPEPHLVEAVVDGERVAVASDRTVCLDHPARFARLNDRYGRWGLALLESVVRCADTTVSEEGS